MNLSNNPLSLLPIHRQLASHFAIHESRTVARTAYFVGSRATVSRYAARWKDPVSEEPIRIKQVIVMRHDLKMRRGKQIAQAAHASMSFLCRRLQERGSVSLDDCSEVERAWLTGAFAKVCCRVDSEEALMAIHEQAVAAGLEVHLITDSGRTGFHGVPTRTCLAIGPDEAVKIDAITGSLQLL